MLFTFNCNSDFFYIKKEIIEGWSPGWEMSRKIKRVRGKKGKKKVILGKQFNGCNLRIGLNARGKSIVF